jgi:hypothetical protein
MLFRILKKPEKKLEEKYEVNFSSIFRTFEEIQYNQMKINMGMIPTGKYNPKETSNYFPHKKYHILDEKQKKLREN